jgi:leader peptidase (prepilin peptidase)/N-methyltransferase
MELLPAWFPVLVWTVVGLLVGSFLNVAIYRLPLEGETVSKPRRSRCPECKTMLTWKENVPVFSWLLQRGRCRHCRWPIPWRYPLVELLTAFLFWLVASRVPGLVGGEGQGPFLSAWGLVLVQSVVLAGLVVATFVDFDHFEIPDEVSIGGMFLAPVCSLLVPELHRATRVALELSSGPGVDRGGSLAGSLAGLLVGGGILWALGWIGSRLYGRDAMGFGDVKLLAAGGGFVGPGGALVALLVASLVASVVGIANMLRFTLLVRARARSRGGRKGLGKALRVGRIAGRYLPFGPYLALGIGITLLAWNDVARLLNEFFF